MTPWGLATELNVLFETYTPASLLLAQEAYLKKQFLFFFWHVIFSDEPLTAIRN